MIIIQIISLFINIVLLIATPFGAAIVYQKLIPKLNLKMTDGLGVSYFFSVLFILCSLVFTAFIQFCHLKLN